MSLLRPQPHWKQPGSILRLPIPICVQLTEAFMRLKSPRVRRRLIDLAETLGDEDIVS